MERANHKPETWQIRVLFDGECPLCAREIRFIEWLDRGRGRIEFEDICKPSFDPSAYGLDAVRVMARMHGVLPDGSIVEGFEVFRRAYEAVGLGWLLAPTRWPLLRDIFESGYRIFAKNRLRWTGREADCETGCRQLRAYQPKAKGFMEQRCNR
jgi:predicted DCC family thiol-disulfide oxidoreductase YuxK